MDSKASTPFSQALRISRMAAEMLRQASCHFICLHGGGTWVGDVEGAEGGGPNLPPPPPRERAPSH